MITLQQLEEEATSYAIGFADDAIQGGSPEFRGTVERAIATGFLAGARYVLAAANNPSAITKDIAKQAVAQWREHKEAR